MIYPRACHHAHTYANAHKHTSACTHARTNFQAEVLQRKALIEMAKLQRQRRQGVIGHSQLQDLLDLFQPYSLGDISSLQHQQQQQQQQQQHSDHRIHPASPPLHPASATNHYYHGHLPPHHLHPLAYLPQQPTLMQALASHILAQRSLIGVPAGQWHESHSKWAELSWSMICDAGAVAGYPLGFPKLLRHAAHAGAG